MKNIRTAVICDWLVTYAGAERVLEQILACFPHADVFALVDFLPEEGRGFIAGKHAKTSFIQNLPKAKTQYRNYLPLMPLAIEQFDLSKYNLIISSSHAVAKGVLVGRISCILVMYTRPFDMLGIYSISICVNPC